ncbi:S1 family peptidase [Burkholderia paludis]|uniref:S1 family peptidase n=1 Tax=Burkholderia paludis TaxID=1506587 RepID=UPI00190F0AAB|nr:serine protease [Burkholderia paludis]
MHDFKHISQAVFLVGRVGPGGVNLLGTVFLLDRPGHFATAAHVVGGDGNNLVLVTRRTILTEISAYQDATDAEVATLPLALAEVDPFHDLAILKADIDYMSSVRIAGSDAAAVGTPIVSFGFPHADHGRMVLTSQDAEVGARVLIPSGPIKGKYLVLNTLARPGQSGSPVFRKDDGQLVAVLVGAYAPTQPIRAIVGGIDPSALHQTTHAVSAEYLLGMY